MVTANNSVKRALGPQQMPRTFDTTNTVRESEWLSGPHRSSLYVWLHIDDTGAPFYVGRGRGKTAWERNGGPAWAHYVTHRLGGCYHVVIPAYDLDDQQSEAILEEYLSVYGPTLLNQSNYNRGMDLAAYARRRPLDQELRPLYALLPNTETIEQRIMLARRGIELQYEINDIRLETGLFGEVLREMGADCSINMFFIKPLVEGLVESGRPEEARASLANFLGKAPHHAGAPTMQRLQKIAARGTLVRRKVARAP